MNELIRAKNLLSDHINERIINEKMDLEDENNKVLYEILDILTDQIKDMNDEFEFYL